MARAENLLPSLKSNGKTTYKRKNMDGQSYANIDRARELQRMRDVDEEYGEDKPELSDLEVFEKWIANSFDIHGRDVIQEIDDEAAARLVEYVKNVLTVKNSKNMPLYTLADVGEIIVDLLVSHARHLEENS
jgi:hypothetical protein